MPTSRTRTATVTMSNSTNKKMASKNTFVTSAGSGNRQGKGETGRRSLAVDPSLMHSSSEGEGEGGLYPEDGSVDANMTKRAHKMNERTAVKSQDIGRSVVDSPRTRRSTRLSGDQLDSGNLITARTVTGAKTSSSYNTEKSGKRKVPPSPVATIHPTPPDTDAEFNEMNMTVHVNSKKSNGSNSKSAITSSSVITNGKKHRTAPAKVDKPNLHSSGPTSDSSDDFAFTRMDPPSASHSASKPAQPQAKPLSSAIVTASSNPSASLPVSVKTKTKRKANEIDSSVSESVGSRIVSDKISKSKTKKGRVAELSRDALDEPSPSLSMAAGGTVLGTPPASTSVPVYTQETPAIQRNMAMRAGTGLGLGSAPTTPGSARRVSGDMRGRRGSSIGNGFEALPHPSLPTETLYKHIKADDPPAIRFRTLATWSMHRLKESLQQNSRGMSTSVREGASKVLDGVIKDLAEKKVALNWSPKDATDDLSTSGLPPHPQNLSNHAKLESCKAWSDRLKAEDEARNARIHQYKLLTESISRLAAPTPPPPSTPDKPVEDLLNPNWDLAIPRMRNKEDILIYGKQLLLPIPPASKAKKGKGKQQENTEDPNIIVVESELGLTLDDTRHQGAHMHQISYRVDQLLHIGETFMNQHLEDSHLALSQLSRPFVTLQNASHPSSARDLDGLVIAGVPGRLSTSARGDARDLLRGISKADSGRKKGN